MANERANPTSGAHEAHPPNDLMARLEAMMAAMVASVDQRFHQIEEAMQSQNRTPSESMPDHV
ncbi:uncharacterized protein N7529_000005 [Penicillium soppii]|uniref:uncharacterized protein n=1 Tax=Penicillium soppii TaxID=69789 RepID=UPI0025499FCC|nr:uncharacterized protein N7529_000005 [Penicillium soppii]KAJ5881333.1 hypothetical protein N7529_000005 [Penicillium soppii]